MGLPGRRVGLRGRRMGLPGWWGNLGAAGEAHLAGSDGLLFRERYGQRWAQRCRPADVPVKFRRRGIGLQQDDAVILPLVEDTRRGHDALARAYAPVLIGMHSHRVALS
jgi:hypothetical protein